MEIKHLKIFIAIAEGKSMASVAEDIGITKSAISHIIQNIENEIGMELLIRNKYMQLTDSGSLFLSTSKKIIATYESGIDQMHMLRGGVTGDLRIGIGGFVEPIIRKAAAHLLKGNPSLRIDAHVYRANTLNQLLKSGKLDVAFTINSSYEGEGIISIPCIPLRIVAAMSHTHPLAKQEKVSFDDLCRFECIMPSDDRRALATINNYIDVDLSKLRNRVNINTAEGALAMAAEEDYITFATPTHLLHRRDLIYKPIEGLEMEITAYMHYLKDVHLKKSAEALLKELKEYTIPITKIMTESPLKSGYF